MTAVEPLIFIMKEIKHLPSWLITVHDCPVVAATGTYLSQFYSISTFIYLFIYLKILFV